MQAFGTLTQEGRHRFHRWWSNHLLLLVQIGVVLGVLLASVVVGVRPSQYYMLALAGGFALLIFVRWPILGLLLTILAGFAVKYYGPSGLNITMMGAAFLLAVSVAQALFLRKHIGFYSRAITWPVIALSGAALLSLLVGQLPWFPVERAPLGSQIAAFALIVISGGVLLLMANRLGDVRSLQLLSLGFLAYASLHVAGWFLPGNLIDTREFFTYGSTGSLFWIWIVCLSLAFALFDRRAHLMVRILLFILAVATTYVAFRFQNDWKSGWVPVLAGVGFMLYVTVPRLRIPIILGGLLTLVYIAPDIISTDQYSYSTRLDAWSIMGDIIRANPVLGLGPANYYWYTPLFPIRGYFVQFNSHSQYIDLVAQFGVVGLACYLWIYWALFRVGWKLRHNPALSSFERSYVYGALSGGGAMLVASLLGDWVLPFFYNVGLAGFRASILGWVFLGGLVAIERIHAQEMAGEGNDTDERLSAA